MSRSKRKTPICSITCSGFRRGEKDDKRIANRSLRRQVKKLISRGEEHVVIDKRDVSSTWGFRKDGKQRFDPKRHPGLMRK